jgi:hypothetical protein
MNARIYKALLRLCPILICCTALAKEPQVLVLYPASDPPVNSIYATTIKGIETKLTPLGVLPIEETARYADLRSTIDHLHPDIIIALGNKAAEFIKQSPYRGQSLLGLVYFNPAEYHGVSLRLDNQVLASHLRRLTPGVRRILIVENSSHRLLQQNPSTTVSKPLLEVRTGNGLIATLRTLGQILEQDARPDDAVLIPADIPTDILYEASKMAWNKNIMLLSTNLSHLEYGVLMTFSPDLHALGEQLGDMANHRTMTYEPVKKLNISLNKRVAQHLDIQFDPPALSSFSLVLE